MNSLDGCLNIRSVRKRSDMQGVVLKPISSVNETRHNDTDSGDIKVNFDREFERSPNLLVVLSSFRKCEEQLADQVETLASC
jgi:hypothetical protein